MFVMLIFMVCSVVRRLMLRLFLRWDVVIDPNDLYSTFPARLR